MNKFGPDLNKKKAQWRKRKKTMRGGTRGMMQTHVEYDDFGEYVETIDLMPIAIGQQDGSRLAGDQNLVLAS